MFVAQYYFDFYTVKVNLGLPWIINWTPETFDVKKIFLDFSGGRGWICINYLGMVFERIFSLVYVWFLYIASINDYDLWHLPTLTQSWTCFEPPKTIVKRMLLQELQQVNRNESLFSMNKDKKVSTLEESSPCHIDARIPSIVFPASNIKGKLLSVVDLVYNLWFTISDTSLYEYTCSKHSGFSSWTWRGVRTLKGIYACWQPPSTHSCFGV